TPVLFMPAQEFAYFNDADVGALIAYIRSLPAVDNELPASKVGLLPRVLYLTRRFDLVPAERIDHQARSTVVSAGVTREYGEYIAKTGGCFGCHGAALTGGRLPGAPPSHPPPTNITPAGIGDWSEADFIRAMRTGIRPDGRAIDPFMPWSAIGQLTDTELRALWLYLRSVAPVASGKN
ncbi:MAG TPA: c-type cytochrome, partial [Longimicrobiales bacterium]|nr:c-type cytochrome [Longimicrobiales bacterium]